MIRELPYREPSEIAERLQLQPGFAFLDSAANAQGTGRWSFIGLDPFGTFRVADGLARWNGEPVAGSPLGALKALLHRFALSQEHEGPPLQGGCIGYLAYDLSRLLERLDEPARCPPDVAQIALGFFDLILAFDSEAHRLLVCSSGLPEPAGPAREARAAARLADLLHLLKAPTPPLAPFVAVPDWTFAMSADDYRGAVERVRAHIREGDIYQANIAQRFTAALPSNFDPWSFYRRLRTVNPAPFAAFLRDGAVTIASSSPERLARLRGGVVEARPIKGTAPRSADPAEDTRLSAALMASPKDRAENTMIVDLLRNDLSRVCRPGSVAVPLLCGLESYASVHHLTSVVTGELKAGLSAVDLIEAAFPGGSITGAPKPSAMNIITAVEGAARGVYCGSIGYIGFDGSMDLSVAIRTVTLGPDVASFQAGCGITLASDPQAEYAESLAKAGRLFEAFGAAPRQLDGEG